jgi:hypothetical protein
MGLSMASGIATSLLVETVALMMTQGMDLQRSARTAFGMSFISMLAMEAAENGTDYMITGGVIDTGSAVFWGAIPVSMAAGFLAALPYNYHRLRKYGKSCH